MKKQYILLIIMIVIIDLMIYILRSIYDKQIFIKNTSNVIDVGL